MVRKMCALVFTFRAKPVQLPRQRSGDVRGDDLDVPVASERLPIPPIQPHRSKTPYERKLPLETEHRDYSRRPAGEREARFSRFFRVPRISNAGSEETVAKLSQDDLIDIDHLQKEAERYRSEARRARTGDRRKYLTLMAKLSETMASNEKMRAWLDDFITELKSGIPLRTSRP